MRKIRRIIKIGVTITVLFTLTAGSISACTGFTSSNDETTLVGNNFDWSRDFNVYMNFFPAEEGKYGRVLFDMWWPWEMEFGSIESEDYFLPIQGMNDQGLFFDTYYTPTYTATPSDKPVFQSDDPDYYDSSFWAYCLAKCSTVPEVLDVFSQYNLGGTYDGQLFFVDRNGDSVIWAGDDIIYKEGDFQVVTNFLQNHPERGGYPCWRYDTAVSMLENMTELSIDYFRSICNATHDSDTVFSTVYNLIQEKMYVHYFNNYEKVVEFDLNEELAKGRSRTFLGSLFEPKNNQPPEKPNPPTGPESGNVSTDYKYTCRKINDPDGDKTTYLFDWGDGTTSNWITPYMGFGVSSYHNYSEKGNYEIKVKARDIYGKESEWSDPLVVSMPKNKIININPIIIQFLENYPHLFPILRQILLFLG